MKDLSKRFINVHGSYSPVQTLQPTYSVTNGYSGQYQAPPGGSQVPLLPAEYSYYCYQNGQQPGLELTTTMDKSMPEMHGMMGQPIMQTGVTAEGQDLQTLMNLQIPCQNGSYQLIPLQSGSPVSSVLPPTSPIMNYTTLQPHPHHHQYQHQQLPPKKSVVTSPGLEHHHHQGISAQDYLISTLHLKDAMYPISTGLKPTVLGAGHTAMEIPDIMAANPYIRMSPGIPAGALVSPVQGTNLISLRSRTSPACKPRSPLLEAFRNNRCPILSLPDISQHAIEFSKDQHGSRFIQQKLEHSTQQHILSFWQELEPSVLELMTDVFGNYVVQKLVDFGGQTVQHKLLEKVMIDVSTLSKHQFGCRVVQKIIAIFPKNTAAAISKGLEGNLRECIHSQHANHVIQKLVEKVDSTVLQSFIDICRGKIAEISCDEYGCRIIQRFLENATEAQRCQILSEVDPNIYHLLKEQYGNYIVQHILDHGTSNEIDNIIKSIGGHVVELAQHKYASNVLEKCIEKTKPVHRGAFVTELVGSTQVSEMIEGQYSNYVLQKMMDTAPIEVVPALMEALRLQKPSMEKHSYGKNIWARVEKYYIDNPTICKKL